MQFYQILILKAEQTNDTPLQLQEHMFLHISQQKWRSKNPLEIVKCITFIKKKEVW